MHCIEWACHGTHVHRSWRRRCSGRIRSHIRQNQCHHDLEGSQSRRHRDHPYERSPSGPVLCVSMIFVRCSRCSSGEFGSLGNGIRMALLYKATYLPTGLCRKPRHRHAIYSAASAWWGTLRVETAWRWATSITLTRSSGELDSQSLTHEVRAVYER